MQAADTYPLGITVAGGAAAIVRELPAHTTFAPAVVLQQAAGAFAATSVATARSSHLRFGVCYVVIL